MMVWLIGRDGMLGQEVSSQFRSAGLRFVASGLEIDITNAGAVSRFARDADPDWIVNCAAYTAVDRAEEDEATAFAVNADGVAHVAAAARERGASVLHISTDYVFSGEGDQPHGEDDPVGPESAYGRSKASGEAMLRATTDQSVIVRSSWMYGHGGPNFVDTMLRQFRERDEIAVVADQYGSPTSAKDLAAALVHILKCHGNGAAGSDAYGIFHFTSSGATTWYDYAREIHRYALELGMVPDRCSIRPVSTRDYPRPAPRPANSRLSTERIARVYGITTRPWREALHEYLHELHDGGRQEASR